MRDGWETYMRRLLGTFRDVGAGRFGELGVPDQVLRAVQAAPVPVGAHHGADEVGVVFVGGRVVDEIAWLDFVGGGGDGRGGCEGEQGGEDLHVGSKGRGEVVDGGKYIGKMRV
jgi:hypothetical protein